MVVMSAIDCHTRAYNVGSGYVLFATLLESKSYSQVFLQLHLQMIGLYHWTISKLNSIGLFISIQVVQLVQNGFKKTQSYQLLPST